MTDKILPLFAIHINTTLLTSIALTIPFLIFGEEF